ncbi:MAG: hypothetical protein LPK19_02355 [Hymenobacteraceae bacterium]|nr:hypothetical protein [Hymenobacteraceae bacterium]MDX5511053.1 hypothetical protein [Hymenobacteraceae bacterium]
MWKKLTIVAIILFNTTYLLAQNNRFYISLQGGPQLSFSETNGGYFTRNVNAIPTWQAGAYGGYTFRNQKITLETGAQLVRYDVRLDYRFRNIANTEKGPDLIMANTAWQVPLRFKYLIVPVENKLKVSAILGAKLLIDNYRTLNPETELEKVKPDRNGYYYLEENGREVNFAILSGGGINNIVIIEGGVEVAYQVSEKVSLNSRLIYQNGIDNYYFVTHYHGEPNGLLQQSELYNTSTRAEALALSFGLSYHFSTRDKE